MHAHEGGDGRVDPRQFQRDHAVEHAAAARAAIAGAGQASDAERGEPGHQVVREFLPGPVVVDYRRDGLLHEVPHRHDQLAAVGVEQLLERVEVGVDGRIHAGLPSGFGIRNRPGRLSAPAPGAVRNWLITGASSAASVTRPRWPPSKDVQRRARDQPVHDPGISQRDDRVVVAGHDQRRLREQRQERQAGPARAGRELVEVAARGADPVVRVHGGGDAGGIGPGAAAVEVGRDAAPGSPRSV